MSISVELLPAQQQALDKLERHVFDAFSMLAELEASDEGVSSIALPHVVFGSGTAFGSGSASGG